MQSKRRVPVLCIGLFCGMFEASSASKQQMQEYRERSQARDCQCSRLLLGKRMLSSSHHRSSLVAAPCPRGVVVRRCPGAVRSHPRPDPGRSVGPGFLARVRGRNETETCRPFFCIAVAWVLQSFNFFCLCNGRVIVLCMKHSFHTATA